MAYQQPYVRLHCPPGSRILVPGDIHFGSADVPALEAMIACAEEIGVTGVVLQGDTFDAGGISTHRKSAKRQTDGSLTVAHEVNQARPLMESMLAMVNGNGYIMPGNHEDRVERLVDDNPALAGLSWDVIYGAALVGWEVVPHGAFVRAGRVDIHHGHTLTGLKFGGGLTPAKTILGNYPGQNTLFGHCHRKDIFTRPTWLHGRQVEHGAWCVGHMQDRELVGWSGHNAWERSFAIISYFEDEAFTVDLASFRDGKAGQRVFIMGQEF